MFACVLHLSRSIRRPLKEERVAVQLDINRSTTVSINDASQAVGDVSPIGLLSSLEDENVLHVWSSLVWSRLDTSGP